MILTRFNMSMNMKINAKMIGEMSVRPEQARRLPLECLYKIKKRDMKTNQRMIRIEIGLL